MKKAFLFALAALCVSAVQAVTITWNGTGSTGLTLTANQSCSIAYVRDFTANVNETAVWIQFINQNNIDNETLEEVEILIKYRGYIEREKLIADKLHRLENITIPDGFDYHAMQSLPMEARQKLSRIQPQTIGEASRIPGVSPADINVLLIKFGR